MIDAATAAAMVRQLVPDQDPYAVLASVQGGQSKVDTPQ